MFSSHVFDPLRKYVSHIDWVMVVSILLLSFAGLFVFSGFGRESIFFEKQVIWLVVGWVSFFAVSSLDISIFKRTGILVTLFLIVTLLLLFLFVAGSAFQGARSWFSLGNVAIQPADPAKIVLILMLAKYFSRRHVEIARLQHLIVPGIYAAIPFILIFIQPDFGSAMIIGLIWLGMVMVSGVSKKHLGLLLIAGALVFSLAWQFALNDYQKNRVKTFLDPQSDIHGAGWNAYQSMIAVGSGEWTGKSVGFGTQSRLQFLPEYETDFIFAAFAEEWGFLGALLIIGLYGIVLWRILIVAFRAHSNFEALYAVGVSIYITSHVVVHIGMNTGLLPVTGLPLPFVSYGGSHIVTELIAVGILMSARREMRAAHRDDTKNEFLGVV